MIFVTVGTHEQPFNRLIQKIDELKKDGIINEDAKNEILNSTTTFGGGIYSRTVKVYSFI